MQPQMKLGDFLIAYLKKIGVDHLFGIPGDLVIKLFLHFGKPRGLKVVTLSHEPGVGFAADGYARSSGKLGVVCVTYGAGALNMVNPVAGSFSEKVPILVISGGPGEEERELGVLIHHQAKEIESQLHIYKELTCAAKIIDDPARAAEEIDEVIQAILREHRPGYLEIHRDKVDTIIPVPKRILKWDGRFTDSPSDQRKLFEAARETVDCLKAAKRPVIIVGIEVKRFGLEREMIRLAEAVGAPVLTNVLAKGAFPMDHPLAMGVYIGRLSHPAIRRRVAEADLVLSLGTLLTDIDLGTQPPEIPREKSIWAVESRVHVSFHTYTDVRINDYIKALLKSPLRRHSERVVYHDNLPKRKSKKPAGAPIEMGEVLHEVNDFLMKRKNFLAITESGDSLFAGIDLKVGSSIYLAQGYYASMGFAVPGGLGAQIGTGLRPLILCGDGAFQMTGHEISQAPRHGLNPIVLLLNNKGWGIFRPIAERETL
ncbi:MAG TPA: thiamine pyrophosphate-binding protein, partial [Candidatus Manganitrophaceae bacterium]|nr:thiamine pyrophosphate-binding protein [Candidatus Manganitrophaceae bacterium]